MDVTRRLRAKFSCYLVLASAVVVAGGGCGLTPWARTPRLSGAALDQLTDPLPSEAERAGEADASEATLAQPDETIELGEHAVPGEQAAASEPPADDFAEDLSNDGWHRKPAETLGAQVGPRWRNIALERFLSDPASASILPTALAAQNPVTRANAAIGLARTGDARGRNELVTTVADSRLLLALRCAAAEGLSQLPAGDVRPALAELVASQEQLYGRRAGSYQAALHAELLRSLGRSVPPGADERFTAALAHESPDVRVAALDAWILSNGPLPTAAVDLAADRDPHVRAAAIRAAAAHQAPHAYELVEQSLWDGNLHVRLAAVTALGDLPGDDARQKLLDMLQAEGELVRGAAVASLARIGQREAVRGAAADRSWRVRAVVAQCLAQWPDTQSAALACSLTADTSAEVHRALVTAVSEWPIELSAPVLLELMAAPHLQARAAATHALAARWSPAATFVPAAPEVRRDEMLAALRARLPQELAVAVGRDEERPATATGGPTVSEVELVQSTLSLLGNAAADLAARDEAIVQLVALGPRLAPAVEAALAHGIVAPDALYTEVLPQTDPLFAELARLTSADLAERRGGASALQQRAVSLAASPLARQRVLRVMARERDPAVWRSVMAALASDPSPESALIAQMALAHLDPEVRRRGACYLATYPDPRQVERVAELLAETDPEIVRAALGALAAASTLPADDAALERLMRGHDHLLRVDTAYALARAGDERGRQALTRLAVDDDPQVRRATALAIGELGDVELAPLLRGMQAGKDTAAKAAAESLARLGLDAKPAIKTQTTAVIEPSWRGRRPAGVRRTR